MAEPGNPFLQLSDSTFDYQPSGRCWQQSHIIKDKLYMWGGEQDKSHLCDPFLLENLNLLTGEWKCQQTTGHPPRAVIGYASAVIENDILFFGGYCPITGQHHNSLFKLNVETHNWLILSPTNSNVGHEYPIMKRECGMARVKIKNVEYLVVVGGCGITTNLTKRPEAVYKAIGNEQICTNEVHYYDVLASCWSSVTSSGKCPPPCYSFTMTALTDQRIIMFGGNNPSGLTNNVFIGECEETKISWQKITSPLLGGSKWPVGRKNHVMVALNDLQILIMGGTTSTMFSSIRAVEDCWVFDIVDRTWHEVPKLPQIVTNRRYHSLSAWYLNSETVWMVEFGGLALPLNTYLNSTAVIELKLNVKTWSVSHVMMHPLNAYDRKLQIYRKKRQGEIEAIKKTEDTFYAEMNQKNQKFQQERERLNLEIDQLKNENQRLKLEKDQLQCQLDLNQLKIFDVNNVKENK